MLIDWSDEFNTWLDRLEDHADTDPISARRLDYITAQLQHLQELGAELPRPAYTGKPMG